MIEDLGPALRRALVRGALDGVLALHGRGFPALPPGGAGALLARLDAAAQCSPERDALLADLLRLHRRARDGAVLTALLYALLGSVTRLRRQGHAGRRNRAERDADVLHAVLVSLDGYDPDGRSPHVQAGVELDARHRLWRSWRADRRRHAALRRAGEVAGALGDGAHTLDELLGPREAAPRLTFDGEELAVAEARLAGLVEQRVLGTREVTLLARTQLHGDAVAAVARDLGLRPETVKKALLRARRALRGRRREVEALCGDPRGVTREAGDAFF